MRYADDDCVLRTIVRRRRPDLATDRVVGDKVFDSFITFDV